MTDQTVDETKDAGSEEVQVEQTEQADQPEDGSSIKDKVEDVVDSVKDKLTGGDKDSDAGSDKE